jgi:hypothetical protein
MRLNPRILAKNEELISAAVGARALVHFIETKQPVIKGLPHRSLIGPPQQIAARKIRAVAEVNVLIAECGNDFVKSSFRTQRENRQVEIARLEIRDRLIVNAAVLPVSDDVMIIKERGLGSAELAIHYIGNALGVAVCKERELLQVRYPTQVSGGGELPTQHTGDVCELPRAFLLALAANNRSDDQATNEHNDEQNKEQNKNDWKKWTIHALRISLFLRADLCVLCVSVVNLAREILHHRDTENTEDARRFQARSTPNLDRRRFLVLAPHLAKAIADFADGRVRLNAFEYSRQQVFSTPSRFRQTR